MLLVQCTRIQKLSRKGAEKVNLQMITIPNPQRAVAVIVVVGKLRIRRLRSHAAGAFNVARSSGNDVHRGARVLHTIGVRGAVDDGEEALRVMYVAEDAEVHAITVQ